MTIKFILYSVFLFLFNFTLSSQKLKLPPYFIEDKCLNDSLFKIVRELKLDSIFDVGEDGKEQISLAVVDLNATKPLFGGVNPSNFIYPASVYKMYVGASVLSQISKGQKSLYDWYITSFPNMVDNSKFGNDPRALLKAGDTITINYLLDLMITRSDNSAANCLIDIAGRPYINEMMHKYHWYGSEITRKFLKRKFEDRGYDTIRGTETCALHAADFMYLIYSRNLESPWVSMQMESYLSRQLDTSKIASGLSPSALFYHKSGWFAHWTNDVGIVADGNLKYIVACFIPLNETIANPLMQKLSSRIYNLIKNQYR
jgi:beta-lactamase class A